MARWGLDKVAAAHLLEALRASSDHLRDLAIGEAARVTSGGRATSVMYAHVRRLRTYVQRCASACTEVVALDLDDDDRNLLAACAVFEIASLDRKLSGAPRPSRDEIGWLEDRRRALTHWAVAFATRCIDPIPADPNLALSKTAKVVLRDVLRGVLEENGPAGRPPVHDHPAPADGAADPPPAAPPADPAGPAPASGRDLPGNKPDDTPGYAAPPFEFGIPTPIGAQRARQAAPPPPAPVAPARPFPAPADDPPAGAAATSRPAPEFDEVSSEAAEIAYDLDPRRFQDPRLRALVQLDLRALERACRANDRRLFVVHLASILEASCIDYALAHRDQLALSGPPEGWNPDVVVQHVLGDAISSMDRALLFQLHAARNLLRPATQLTNPMVVTATTQAELTRLLRRLLVAMGYAGSGDMPAPASAAAGVAGGEGVSGKAGAPVLPDWLRGS